MPHPNLMKRVTQANRNYNKVFGIGYNKTGTTSLAAALALYGFNMPEQAEQEARLTKQTFLGNYEPLRNLVNSYDAFQDLPFSQGITYIVVDVLFPNSKFILTERDPHYWFESMVNFHKKIFGIKDLTKLTKEDIAKQFKYLYPGYNAENTERLLTEVDDKGSIVRWDKLYDREYYVKKYLARNKSIKKYFLHRPQQLLVIDITKATSTADLCKFLNIPEEYIVEMPRENVTMSLKA